MAADTIPPPRAAAPTERTPLLNGNGGAAPSPPADESHEQPHLTRGALVAAIASVWTILFFAALDGTVASTLLAPISSSFNAAEKAPWLGTSFLLSVCAFTPLYGRLSDAFGRSRAMLTALFFFTLGTAGCAWAPSIDALLAARAIAGMGAGGILTCASIIMTDLVTLRQRGLFQGLGNIIFALGGALGGLYGGVMNDAFSWRAAFGLQVPFLLGAFVLVARYIHVPQVPVVDAQGVPLTTGQKLKRIDWLGSALLVSGVGSLLILLSILSTGGDEAGRMPGFSDRRVLSSTIVLACSVVAFLLVESLLVAQPILPIHLLKLRSPACISAVYFVSSCAYYSLFFYYPLYFQAVRGYSASQAGLRIMPLAIFTASGSVGAGLIMKATGRYWWLQTCAGILPVFSMGSLIFWTPTWPGRLGEFTSVCPAGLGLAAMYTTLIVACMASVPRKDFATANGLIYLCRTLGQVIGVGVAGAVMQAVLVAQLRKRITGPGAYEIIGQIQHSIAYIDTLPPKLAQAARLSYADGLRVVFIGVTVLNFVAWLCSLGIEERSIDGPAAVNKPASAAQEPQPVRGDGEVAA